MELYIGNVFWANEHSRTMEQTMEEITARGINVIRFPIVPQTLDASDPQGRDPYLKNYEPLRQTNARQAMEDFIVMADQYGLEVMLDIHSCSNYVGWRAGRFDARPPYADADRDLYDYFREDYSCAASGNPSSVDHVQAYDKAAWLDDLRELAGLADELGVDNIIGVDIFNEPWDYTWAEWKTNIEDAYQAIDEVNSDLLIFAQGISASAGNQDGNPDDAVEVPHGDEFSNPNWGENLYEAGADLPNVPQSRLVFSPHTYGPSVFVQSMFMDPAEPECEGLSGDEAGDLGCNIVINPELLRPGWEEHFGYLRDMGYAIVVGEFGGHYNWPQGSSERDLARWGYITDNVDEQWQNAFVDYMDEKNIEACYWSINPESGDTGGLYSHAYDPISNTGGWGTWTGFEEGKWSMLNRLWD